MKFSCETAHNGKSLISVFQEFFASIDKILAGRLGTGLPFYGLPFYDTFLIFPNFLRS